MLTSLLMGCANAGLLRLCRHRFPSDLKLVVGGLGIVVMAARAQDDTLHVHLPRENRYLVGHPEDVLYTLTGVDLSYYAYHRAILGLPNLSPLDASRVVRFEPGRENIFLELQHGLYLRRLWIEARTGFLREERVYNAGGQLVSARVCCLIIAAKKALHYPVASRFGRARMSFSFRSNRVLSIRVCPTRTLFCPCPEMPHVTIFNGKDKSLDADKKEHWFDLESVLFC